MVWHFGSQVQFEILYLKALQLVFSFSSAHLPSNSRVRWFVPISMEKFIINMMFTVIAVNCSAGAILSICYLVSGAREFHFHLWLVLASGDCCGQSLRKTS